MFSAALSATKKPRNGPNLRLPKMDKLVIPYNGQNAGIRIAHINTNGF
jgi:hypothetical protein